jgi:hypothetical protein
MENHKEDYFIAIQKVERDLIKTLFNNYFEKRSCKNLTTTPLTGFSRYDGMFTSGASEVEVVFEFKRRNILSTKFSDTIIESSKFLELYKQHQQGKYTLFVIEYDDHYFLFDLQNEFRLFKCYEDDPFSFFSELSAAKNQFNSEVKQDKYVRYLPFHSATYILDKDLKTLGYNHYLSFRVNDTD